MVDLPGHGRTPPAGAPTVAGLVAELERFLAAERLDGVDAVGSSLGGRLVLELARRGRLGAVVALDPGGFWEGWERAYLRTTLGASVRLARLARPLLPALTGNPLSRAALFAQLSAHPARLPAALALREARSLADTPSFDALLRDLSRGPGQAGAPEGSIRSALVIGWGRQDRLTLPVQAARAQARFPDARLHWFERCGHFPQWDRPDDTARLVLDTVGS